GAQTPVARSAPRAQTRRPASMAAPVPAAAAARVPVEKAAPVPVEQAAPLPAEKAAPLPPTPIRVALPDAHQAPPLPAFLTAKTEPTRRWRAAVFVGVAMAAAAGGFQTRELWLPQIAAAVQPVPGGAPASVGLNTLDVNGQLQIRWDPNSPSVRKCVNAVLEIADGPLKQTIAIHHPHLDAGVFTYGRQGQRAEA